MNMESSNLADSAARICQAIGEGVPMCPPRGACPWDRHHSRAKKNSGIGPSFGESYGKNNVPILGGRTRQDGPH